MISLHTIAFVLFAIGAFGWIRALIIERNKWREKFFTEHRARMDAEIAGGLFYEKPKRKNDEVLLDAIEDEQQAEHEHQQWLRQIGYPAKRPEPFKSNTSYK